MVSPGGDDPHGGGGDPHGGGERPHGGGAPHSDDAVNSAPPADGTGAGIVRLDVWATAVFTLVSLAAAAAPDPLEYVSVPLDLMLFALGCGAFLWAYAVAIGRSRYEVLSMGGVFFLSEQVAPAPVRRTLRACLAAQVLVAVLVASVRPFTGLAFAVLVPVLGLGLMALWGGRHGRFPARPAEGQARARR